MTAAAGADGESGVPTVDRWAELRSLHAKWSVEYGTAVYELLRDGAHEEGERVAFLAWAHWEAAKADHPRLRFEALHAERFGRERPHLRLVSSRGAPVAEPAGQRPALCPHCGGTGLEEDAGCEFCDGTGRAEVQP